MIGKFISGFVVLLFGITLYSPIKVATTLATNSNSINGTSTGTILSLVPIFFLITIIAMAVGIFYATIRDEGFIGVSEEYREDYEEAVPTHPQTYEEYVIERLKVERMIRWGPILGRIF